jgi:hypothetical protein
MGGNQVAGNPSGNKDRPRYRKVPPETLENWKPRAINSRRLVLRSCTQCCSVGSKRSPKVSRREQALSRETAKGVPVRTASITSESPPYDRDQHANLGAQAFSFHATICVTT